MHNRARYLQRLGIANAQQVAQHEIQEKESILETQQESKVLEQQKESVKNLTENLQGFEKEIAKYFDGPVTFEEKEESTADDNEDDRVGDLEDMSKKPDRNETKSRGQSMIQNRRLQLSQSFINRDGDFLINYYIQQEDSQKIRNKYINKLISNNILRQEPSKKHQTMIIFDWDDTLFCTSQLHAQRFENITLEQQKGLQNLNKSASLCLQESAKYGETYIITNAAQGWVEYSSRTFLPAVNKCIEELKIKVISARSLYESKYPGRCHQWKVEAFKDLKQDFDKQIITNLICIGDSQIEMEAAHLLGKEFEQSFIKTVKFKEQPRIEDLIKQQDLVRDKLEQIYTNFKNLTIRLEKKSTSQKDIKE